MRSYTLTSPAKINLYLEIISDRPDGYHELAMVLQSVGLSDQIDLRSSSTESIQVHCDHPLVPSDKTNLAYRAAELMAVEFPQAFAQYGGVAISINKRIPVGAGLAGGSSNAAAVLVGIDLLWHLGLTQSELQELAATIGSDVPFCVAGGTALATGRGEQLSPLPNLEHPWVVLGKYRNLAVSTPWAYQTYRQKYISTYVSDADSLEARRQRVHSGSMVNAIFKKNEVRIGQLLHNDLEKVVLPEYPQVLRLREAFYEAGVLGAMMSGSGPTVFALSESEAKAQQVQQHVRKSISDPNLDLWVAPFTTAGIQVVAH